MRTSAFFRSNKVKGILILLLNVKNLIYFIYTSVLLAIITSENDLHICVLVVVRCLKEFHLRDWPCALIFFYKIIAARVVYADICVLQTDISIQM
jgi:hypothetical protein